MGFWPFGSSSRKSRRNSTAVADAAEGSTPFDTHTPAGMARRPPAASAAAAAAAAATATTSISASPAAGAAPSPVVATRQTNRPTNGKPRKLSKARTASAPPVDGLSHPRTRATPGGGGGGAVTARSNGSNQATSSLYLQTPASQLSIGPEVFSASPQPPTLHAKRPEQDSAVRRSKSAKRKADDSARQKEIQAMSASMSMPRPKRPATYSGSGPLTRDTTTVPGDMNISLPRQEDIVGQDAVPASFKVGVLSALSPRPLVKYESRRQSGAGKQPARYPVVSSSEHAILEEEDLAHSKSRIDDLADNLDSSGIRELLERDRRHRERRKEADRARLQRKLQRRADRQREEETRRKRVEEFASQSSARLGADVQRLPGDEATASGALREAPVDASHEVSQEPEPTAAATAAAAAAAAAAIAAAAAAAATAEDPFAHAEDGQAKDIRNPFEDEKDMDVMQEPSDLDDEHTHPVPVKSPVRKAQAAETWEDAKPSQAALSPPTSPIEAPADTYSFSQTSGTGRKVTPDTVESIDRDVQAGSGQNSSQQNASSWTSFFKIRGRRKARVAADRGRTTPSDFSNTSRESFARQPRPPPPPPPPPTVPAARMFRRSDSALPQRTLSRFREDLPELPISPPDSRVHSPEAAGSHLSSKRVRQSLSGTLDDKSLGTNSSNPALDKQRPDSHPQQASHPVTTSAAAAAAAAAAVIVVSGAAGAAGSGREGDSTSPEPAQPLLTRSLASVDSEASWLSGKPVKRSSGPASLSWRHSTTSLAAHLPAEIEQEEDDLVKDEYLCQLSPAPQRRQESPAAERKPSSVLIDFEQEQDQAVSPEQVNEHWHHGVARQPTLVRHAEAAKSKEGLLRDFQDGDDDDDDEELSSIEADSPRIDDSIQVMRAHSVDYRGHVRRVSAGSARLLDIRRSSTASNPRSRPPSTTRL